MCIRPPPAAPTVFLQMIPIISSPFSMWTWRCNGLEYLKFDDTCQWQSINLPKGCSWFDWAELFVPMALWVLVVIKLSLLGWIGFFLRWLWYRSLFFWRTLDCFCVKSSSSTGSLGEQDLETLVLCTGAFVYSPLRFKAWKRNFLWPSFW